MGEISDKIESLSKDYKINTERGAVSIWLPGYIGSGVLFLLSYWCAREGLVPVAYVNLVLGNVVAIGTYFFNKKLEKFDSEQKAKDLGKKNNDKS